MTIPVVGVKRTERFGAARTFASLYARPRSFYREILPRNRVVPWLFAYVLLASVLSALTWSGQAVEERLVTRLHGTPQASGMSEQQLRVLASRVVTVTRIAQPVQAGLWAVVRAALLAALLLASCRLLLWRRRLTFRQCVVIACPALLAIVVIKVTLLLTCDIAGLSPGALDVSRRTTAGLVAVGGTYNEALRPWLQRTDLFTLWSVWLLSAGLAEATAVARAWAMLAAVAGLIVWGGLVR